MPNARSVHDPEAAAFGGFYRTERVTPRLREDVPEQHLSTYWLADRRGPGPIPDWVITDDAATQREIGLLKTGKEADVHLVERTAPDGRTNLLAAKRYRDLEDRMFRDDARYRESRRTGSSRVDRAMARGTSSGLAFRARQWVEVEFSTLCALWQGGARVPYPVEVRGHELVMEFFGTAEAAAPRLVGYRGDPQPLFADWRETMRVLVARGIVHGDLSPYNLLVADGRLVFIDFPQSVDLALATEGFALLDHDVRVCCEWFAKHGVVEADADVLLGELLSFLPYG